MWYALWYDMHCLEHGKKYLHKIVGKVCFSIFVGKYFTTNTKILIMYSTKCDMHCLEHCKIFATNVGKILFLIFVGKYFVDEKMWIILWVIKMWVILYMAVVKWCSAVLKALGKCAMAFVSLEEQIVVQVDEHPTSLGLGAI